MAARCHFEYLFRTVAFACTLVIGIAAGCLWNAVEAIEDKLKTSKRPVAEKPHKAP
jgi:hypothetical protein